MDSNLSDFLKGRSDINGGRGSGGREGPVIGHGIGGKHVPAKVARLAES